MSTQGKRDFRPKIHFTPPEGWTNDPNGLVKYDGKYHLFYQHNPKEAVWGPMHWGHAVSTDFVNWEHLPIALYPDEHGTIFSGSAVADVENVSGLGKDGKIPLIAFYTYHGEQQTQGIAYSLDGVNFTKYEGNPVIPNPGILDYRDPKMFWNPVHNCWSMVLAAAETCHFYKSKNLLDWEKTGEFGDRRIAAEGNHSHGIWECPDMVPMVYNGKTVWLLIGSMTIEKGKPIIGTQYFLGDFDGDKFINSMPFGYAERLDSGWDNYAGVAFNNVDEPLFIGWGTSWRYAADTPTGVYCGNMTLPRLLSLKDTPVGLRLASFPVELDSVFAKAEEKISGETFLLRVKGKGACKVTLRNSAGQYLCFGVDGENNLFLDRTNAGAKDFNEVFASECSVTKAKRFYDGEYTLDFVFDVSVSELFVDFGTRSMSMVCYPDVAFGEFLVEGDVGVQVFG